MNMISIDTIFTTNFAITTSGNNRSIRSNLVIFSWFLLEVLQLIRFLTVPVQSISLKYIQYIL